MSVVYNVARTISRPASLKVIHTASSGFPKGCRVNVRMRNPDVQQNRKKAPASRYSKSMRGDIHLRSYPSQSSSCSSGIPTSNSSSNSDSSNSNSNNIHQSSTSSHTISSSSEDLGSSDYFYEIADDEISEIEEDLFEIRQCDLLEKGFYTLSCSESQQSFDGGQSACTAIGVSMSRKFLSKADIFSALWFNNSSAFEKIIKTGVKWQRLWASKQAVDVCTKPSAYALCEIEPIAKKVQVNHEFCFGGSNLDKPKWGTSISDALENIFGGGEVSKVSAFLLTVAEYTTFVGKKDSRIMWFDSHLRDINGLQDGNGSAVWMQFYGWENLRDHIIRLYERHKNSKWELVQINLIRS